MDGFTLLKRGECPICGGARKDCRESNQSGMVFCRENANPRGFIFRGTDKWGFGLWQPSEAAEAFAQKSKEEWQREQEQRRIESERRRQQRIASQLPAVDRDKYYQKILNQLSLKQEDLSELERRGFTSEQIKADGYRSVSQWERVSGSFPTNLPGLLSSGSLNSQPGIIFPVRDVESRIVDLSIRLRDGSNGRYRWLTSVTKKNDGASPHLDGELPLSVFEPGEYSGDAIWLTEGVGIKPSLARYRLGVPVVGASSGRFSGSPNTCKLTLEKLSAKCQTQSLIIPVDAGDIQNAQVCHRWQREFEFLRSLGYEIKIAWWGQCSKQDNDIDELESADSIELLTVDRFETICREHGTWEKAETEAATSTPSNESGIRFRRVRKSLEEFLPKFPELESQAGQDWLRMREFTPDYTINSKFFDWQSDKLGVNLAVRSGLGTGKTYHVHNTFLADDNVGANAFGYRNSLLIQFTSDGNKKTQEGKTCKNPWYHLQQDLKESKDDLILVADPSSRIAACFDSLIYFQPHYFEGKRLVLDEIEGGFKHLYQSKTAVSLHRHVCKERIGQAIANSEAAIVLDGNLTDLTVAHAERISGKKFTKVENLYKGNRGKITFYTGTLKFGKDEETGQTIVTERRINDYSLLHKMMMEDSEPFVCGSDSQEKLEAWHDILRLKGRKVFRLDGTNSSTPEAEKFLADPVKYIQGNGIEIILYSPTAESGLSIDLAGYFKRSYYFFFGVVQTNEQTQFLARLRDPDTHIHVFCQNQGIDNGKTELTAEHIQETFIDYALACSRISLADIDETEKQQLIVEEANKLVQRSADPHFQYECHLKAKEVFERNHLRKCLEYALYSAGYQVEVVAGFKVSQQELEAAQEAVQLKKSLELFQAQPLTDKEANDKARKFDATQQDKLEVARHRLVSRLPGIENKTFNTSKVVMLPQSSADEIKSGRVSLETAQKLGIPTPETPIKHGLEVGYLTQNSLNNQGEGVPTSPGEDFNRNGGVPVEEGTDLGQNKTDQNLGGAKPETLTMPAIDLGHLPLNFFINQGEGVPVSEEGEVEVVITETKPIFDPEFIRKVKYQDRAWLSKVELHFLLKKPELAKLLQQRRWYKKLQVFSDPNEPDYVKRLNLTTYKSDWLKIHTLLEMGIEFFLNPESRWTQNTPEVLEFWEKGKDARRARYIGTSVGDSNPCEYIGRVLDKLDVKRKCDRVRNESGEKIRVYRVDTDYLSSPMRKAVYECVEQRIESALQSDSVVLNWDVIVENKWADQTDQKLDIPTPETPLKHGLEVGHLTQNSLNNQGEGVPTSDPTADLAEALPFCESSDDFAAVIEGYSVEVVEDAISLQDSQPRRQQLSQWYAPWWEKTIKAYGQLLSEGFEHGIEAIQELLKPWTLQVRREALLEFEALAPEKMGQLVAIAPNWREWCDA